MNKSIKLGLSAFSIALLSACGGGGSDMSYSFLSVDNTGQGVVCVEDIGFSAYSPEGQQVSRDLVAYYGVANPYITAQSYSAPTYCGGPTANYVPAPNLIIDANYYYDVIVPWVR